MSEFSYQMYSSRNFPPLADTFAMLSEAGYSQVEGFGSLFDSEEQIANTVRSLEAHGLTMPTAHVGWPMINEQKLISKAAEAFGWKAVFVPFIMPEDRPTDAEGWRAVGVKVQEDTAYLRDLGLDTGWHNHDFEFIALPDGTFPIEALLDGGADLKCELDIAWVQMARQEPVAWIEKLGDRVLAAHIKDIAPVGENDDEDGWADVGHGIVDFAPIASALAKTPCSYLVMEHDNPNDHKRFATRSIAHAKTIWT